MCRSVDQPVLISAAFADVGDIRRRLVSVGRYALRGVSHPQELFTLDPDGMGIAELVVVTAIIPVDEGCRAVVAANAHALRMREASPRNLLCAMM